MGASESCVRLCMELRGNINHEKPPRQRHHSTPMETKSMKLYTKLLLAMIVTVLPISSLLSQGLTGQIGSSIQDQTGGVLRNIPVTLENSETKQQRTTNTNGSGEFVFSEILPGVYSISASIPGFKSFRIDGLNLSATQRLALKPIVLAIGNTNQQVSVTSDAPSVETQSSERSGLITAQQITELPTIGRNVLSLLSLVPGVISTSTFESPASGSLDNIKINGSRGQSISLLLDGVPTMDTGNQSGAPLLPGLDSIGEVKVLTSNYQAEYGRSYGGLITINTKSGSSVFHGGGYYFFRNEALNANNFFAKRAGTLRPRYRYNFPGYYVGGPVYIPKLLPRNDKLFFFFSQEFLPVTSPNALVRGTVPTALERLGDFSQSLDTNGVLIPVINPDTQSPFPNNRIPSSRFSAAGQALLNYFPLPNAVDPNRTFNEVLQSTTNSPYRFETIRLDYNINASNQAYVRWNHTRNSSAGLQNGFGDSGYPHFFLTSNSPAMGLVGTYIHTFSSTLVNEATAGYSHFDQFQEIDQASAASNNRTNAGVNIAQFYPVNNSLNLLPNTSFGGVQNPLNINYEQRFPFTGADTDSVYSDNLSDLYRKHNFKVGVYVEHVARDGTAYSPLNSFNGTVDFSRDSNNPYDTNYAYSNALLGSIDTYTEASTRPVADDRYTSIEWFAQDNWRVTKKLTLDLGVRFYLIGPTNQGNGQQIAGFVPSLYNASQAPSLIQPTLNSSGQRVGYNPATGQQVSAVLIGSLAPGSGTFFQGMQTYNGSIQKRDGVHSLPRIGLSYDPFGDGKTAIRAGFGIFPGRVADDRGGDFLTQPPVQQRISIFYTTISQLAGTPAIISPTSVLGIQPVFVPPTTYNYSLGVQRDTGFKTVVSAAYVGGVSRHLLQQNNLNGVAYGSQFTSAGADPTRPGQFLPINFLRPIKGFQDVLFETFSGTANYNSLQVSANRRATGRLSYGMTWTYSKAMDLTDTDQGAVLNPFINPRIRNYGKAGFDRTHDVVLNYDYRVPGWQKNWITSALLGSWESSGILSFISGTPFGISYSDTSTTNITGGGGAGVDSRVDVVGDPRLSRGDRTNTHAFNTAAIARPQAGTFGVGDAKKDVFRGPGIENVDLTLLKNFPLGKTKERNVQFRIEAYNALNHTQFTAIDTGARFSGGGQQINGSFGSYTAAANPRRMQLGIKFAF